MLEKSARPQSLSMDESSRIRAYEATVDSLMLGTHGGDAESRRMDQTLSQKTGMPTS